jgi:hypothetical protein
MNHPAQGLPPSDGADTVVNLLRRWLLSVAGEGRQRWPLKDLVAGALCQARRGIIGGHLGKQPQHRINGSKSLGHGIIDRRPEDGRQATDFLSLGTSVKRQVNSGSVVVPESLIHPAPQQVRGATPLLPARLSQYLSAFEAP